MKSSQAPGQDEDGEALPIVRPRRQEGNGYSDDEILPAPVVHQTGTGEKALLRVRWADYADSAHYWTTLGVYVLFVSLYLRFAHRSFTSVRYTCRTTDTYMADILDMACRKRRLTTSKEFALLLEDQSIIVPLDRTVLSLEGKRSLIIMKKTLIDSLGPEFGRKPGRSSDPNGTCLFYPFRLLGPGLVRWGFRSSACGARQGLLELLVYEQMFLVVLYCSIPTTLPVARVVWLDTRTFRSVLHLGPSAP